MAAAVLIAQSRAPGRVTPPRIETGSLLLPRGLGLDFCSARAWPYADVCHAGRRLRGYRKDLHSSALLYLPAPRQESRQNSWFRGRTQPPSRKPCLSSALHRYFTDPHPWSPDFAAPIACGLPESGPKAGYPGRKGGQKEAAHPGLVQNCSYGGGRCRNLPGSPPCGRIGFVGWRPLAGTAARGLVCGYRRAVSPFGPALPHRLGPDRRVQDPPAA
jgi:hypothetical protein